MSTNTNSLWRGFWITAVFCAGGLLVAFLLGLDGVALSVVIISIVLVVGAPGLGNVPVEHMEVLKKRGKRTDICFKEGWRWIFWITESTYEVSAKRIIVDIPPLEGAFTKTDKVEMIGDIWVHYAVVRPAIYLNLEDPETTIRERLISKAHEALWEFITTHTSNQCLTSKKELQKKIKERMTEEQDEQGNEQSIESRWGITIFNIDVRTIKPTEKVREGFAEDKIREINVKRHTKSMKEILKAAPGLKEDPKTLSNTAFIAEGRVKKEIKEEKKRIEFGVEAETIKTVADLATEFLLKKGGKE